MVKNIMYFTLHLLYSSQQRNVNAKTNKGVSAQSPAAEFSFYDRTEMRWFIIKQNPFHNSNIQQGVLYKIYDYLRTEMEFQHAERVLGNS